MAEFTFACPGCGQHIVGDEAWGGQQMQCPTCRCELIVPQLQPAAAPTITPPPPRSAPAPQVRLSGARTQQPAHVPASTRFTPPPVRRPGEGEEKKNPMVKILTIAGVVIVLGVGGYFGFQWISKMQDK